MKWFKPAPVEAPEVAEPEAVPGSPFEGSLCFGSDGWYYPVIVDSDGNDLGPDKSRPLVYKGGQFLHAEPADISHFGMYGRAEKQIVPGEDG